MSISGGIHKKGMMWHIWWGIGRFLFPCPSTSKWLFLLFACILLAYIMGFHKTMLQVKWMPRITPSLSMVVYLLILDRLHTSGSHVDLTYYIPLVLVWFEVWNLIDQPILMVLWTCHHTKSEGPPWWEKLTKCSPLGRQTQKGFKECSQTWESRVLVGLHWWAYLACYCCSWLTLVLKLPSSFGLLSSKRIMPISRARLKLSIKKKREEMSY